MKKRTTKAFGKKVYLLGTDEYDRYLWLEAPSWDCGWYWGFGYIEEYTNHKNPSIAIDINMHTHWSIIHKDAKLPFKEITMSKTEYINVKRLFAEFYALKGENFCTERGNQDKMPPIMDKIIEILTP